MSTTVWYFAYGSNLQAATLCGRRGIEVVRALPVRVPGWRLVFDKPRLLASTSSVANIVPEDSAAVIGVAFEIPADDHAHVELTEGVAIGNYRRVEVGVEPLATLGSAQDRTSTRAAAGAAGADAAPATALSLASERRAPGLRPSRRYMGLVLGGAIEQGLPEDWIAFLRGIETCEESEAERALRPMLDALFKRR